jgi:hypothetical protein
MIAFLRACLLVGIFSLLLGGTISCSRAYEPTRTVRVAVIDGPILYDVGPEGEIAIKGWWFGAHDRIYSPNSGSLAAESLARELDRLPGVEVYSREDLVVYLGQKERLLRASYPALTPRQRKLVLAQQDPVDFGRSLNVDYVVAPTIYDSVTGLNRTFSWWYSTIDTNVQIYDVATGEAVWAWPYRGTSAFSSQARLYDFYARKVARKVRKADAFGVSP